MRRVPVLIVGGGPVGLALAAELGWRGVPCELVEQGDGAIATPKMNEVNVRTMEFCRRWGVADAVMNCPFPADYPMDVVFVTNLAGYELGRLVRPPRKDQRPGPHSPMNLQVCSQTWFDPILQGLARSFPCVRLRYGCRLASLAHTPTGATATIADADTGEEETIEAAYVAGCDGAGSTVREALGIGLAGPGLLGHPLHMFFRAPGLLSACRRKPGTFFLAVDRDGLWANLRAVDPANDVWRLMVLDAGAATETRENYLRRALGLDHDVEWLGATRWTRKSVVAERYSDGRIFLLGDAAHQLSPTGGLGMNTGIGDAVDLGWKLAATVEGWGGPQLLASYDRERRQIGDRNVRMATEFHLGHAEFGAGMALIEEEGEAGHEFRRRVGTALVRDVGRMFRTLGLQIGYRYEDSPVCASETGSPPPDDPDVYTPSARPGARAPHVALGDGRSVLDLFGRGFVLLRFDDAADPSALAVAAAQRAVPFAIVDLREPEAASLYERRLVLVRPDGHVAWRGDAVPAEALALIDRVRGAG